MKEVCLQAFGKVNIGLDITGTRADGYHLLKTVMQTVGLYDVIRVSKTEQGISVRTDSALIPGDESNLAFRAAKLLFERYQLSGGVRIEIEKHLPVGGGMAGGSTDAAAAIQAIDRLYDLSMTPEEKDTIALRLGADVPFCLRKGTYLAEGIGEILTRLPDLPELPVVICVPGFPVSTPWAYKSFDAAEHPYHPDVDALVAAVQSGCLPDVYAAMGNSLEPVVAAEHPEIDILKKTFLNEGAEQAMMSGSGSTVFGIFPDRDTAERAYEKMKKDSICSSIFITAFIKGACCES